jgi:hypothetical protein
MSEPIVFISHFRIREGRLAAYREAQSDVVPQMQAEKLRTQVFLTYLNEAGTQMTAVHVFADADSMDLHFGGSDERAKTAYEFMVPEGWEIYGTPSSGVLEGMRQEAMSSGVTLTVQPGYVAGFLRTASG